MVLSRVDARARGIVPRAPRCSEFGRCVGHGTYRRLPTMASQGLASALAVLALIAVTEASTCGTTGGGKVSVPGSRGGDPGDACTDCGPRPCVKGDTCYSCCTNPDASGTFHLYPYYCPSGPNTFQCSNSPCQSPSPPPPSSSRRRSPPRPPPVPPRRQSDATLAAFAFGVLSALVAVCKCLYKFLDENGAAFGVLIVVVGLCVAGSLTLGGSLWLWLGIPIGLCA
jgi:hypothetical protein